MLLSDGVIFRLHTVCIHDRHMRNTEDWVCSSRKTFYLLRVNMIQLLGENKCVLLGLRSADDLCPHTKKQPLIIFGERYHLLVSDGQPHVIPAHQRIQNIVEVTGENFLA